MRVVEHRADREEDVANCLERHRLLGVEQIAKRAGHERRLDNEQWLRDVDAPRGEDARMLDLGRQLGLAQHQVAGFLILPRNLERDDSSGYVASLHRNARSTV